MSEMNCYKHKETEASERCGNCLQPICKLCTVADTYMEVCPDCLKKKRRGRAFVKGVTWTALSAAIITVVVFIARYEAPFDYGKYEKRVEKMAATLKRSPCARYKMLRFAKLLNRAGDYRRTTREAKTFFKKCGEYARLRWVTYYAYKKQGLFGEAVKETSVLIKHNPYDQDFRWWRGKMFVRMGKYEKAITDFEQGLALLPRANYIPFDLARAYDKSGKPCKAILPLETYYYNHPRKEKSYNMHHRLSKYYKNKDCQKWLGKGRAEIPFASYGLAKTLGKINGDTEGTFYLFVSSTHVVLSETFAKRLSLQPSSKKKLLVNTHLGRRWAKLKIAKSIEIQGAKAVDVPVAIVKDLKGRDGLLGMGFLARFQMTKLKHQKKFVLAAKDL